jgi:hypothetical protein
MHLGRGRTAPVHVLSEQVLALGLAHGDAGLLLVLHDLVLVEVIVVGGILCGAGGRASFAGAASGYRPAAAGIDEVLGPSSGSGPPHSTAR